MELRLEEALEGPVSWREDVVLTDEELRTLGLLALDAGDASGELRALDGSYLLSARASWHAQLECTRCLEPSDHQSDADFQVLLRRATGEASAAASAEPEEFELEADDLNVVEVADGVVDPRAFVVEQIVLSLPMKALCRENCAGLCPVCGGNRNQQPCTCAAPADPRWGALAGLKEQLDSE